MSRIGKKPINIPKGVEVKYSNGIVDVKGPKGQLKQDIRQEININIQDGMVNIETKDELNETRALQGLYRSLVFNMVKGVTEGFSKTLKITGTGYKAASQGKKLVLNLGYSHPIDFKIPDGIECKVEGNSDTVIINGIDKQEVGQLAANIRSLRPPEPYKGKGVRYSDEIIRRKAGKVSK